ncbi:unnamed protein product [Toxocara canis]|uniref:VWFA domain-containing protein n=1 Tax=Toxocara canis TaxID=6265 RepID=A0A183TUU3_TOXCA|nr:unnamed protein product [Toxocara canis]
MSTNTVVRIVACTALGKGARPVSVVMAPKTTCVVGVLGAIIIALLIVCVGLLSAIFHRQEHPKETTTQAPPQPGLVKNVVVLVDASSGVDNAILGNVRVLTSLISLYRFILQAGLDKSITNCPTRRILPSRNESLQADFLSTQLRDSLLAQSSGYTVRLAATAFASQLSSELSYVDLRDEAAVKTLADKIRNGKTNQPLDIGAALSSLQPKVRAESLGQHTLVVMASSQGQNYANAITQANSLKSSGIPIVAISLKSSGADLAQIASSGSNLDGQAIASGNKEGMQNLANRVSDIVGAQPPVLVTTTTPNAQPQTTTTTPQQPTITTTTKPQQPTPSVQPPANIRVLVLVDASNGITQNQMLEQTSFVTNELMNAFAYPSTHGYTTDVLLVPYAFDTSPDNSEYVRHDDVLAMSKQAMNTKLAPITTFIAPLDRLQIGQAFAEVERYDKSLKPTHMVVLASGQGDDYQTAVTIAKRFTAANVKIISVATVGAANDLKDITSDGVCALDGREILNGQNLQSMANNIAKCIYPQTALPAKPKPKPRVASRTIPAPQKPERQIAYEKRSAPNAKVEQTITSNDIVVLVDTSSYSVADKCITKQSNFISSYLVDAIANVPNSNNARIAVIPYAYFLGAVAEEFAIIDKTNKTLLDSQLRTARIAPITSFMSPLDVYQLEPFVFLRSFSFFLHDANASSVHCATKRIFRTLLLLNESYFVKSVNTKVLLMADDPDPLRQITTKVIELVDHLKSVFIISLTNRASQYYQLVSAKAFDGMAIKNDEATGQQKLANDVAVALFGPRTLRSEMKTLHVPAQMRPIGRLVRPRHSCKRYLCGVIDAFKAINKHTPRDPTNLKTLADSKHIFRWHSPLAHGLSGANRLLKTVLMTYCVARRVLHRRAIRGTLGDVGRSQNEPAKMAGKAPEAVSQM